MSCLYLALSSVVGEIKLDAFHAVKLFNGIFVPFDTKIGLKPWIGGMGGGNRGNTFCILFMVLFPVTRKTHLPL